MLVMIISEFDRPAKGPINVSIFRIRISLSALIEEIISILFIILWVYASISKILDYNNFKFQLGRSPYIAHISTLIAIALPMGEIIIAFLLLFKQTRSLGIYASFFLMFLFTGYIYAMLHYSFFVPCSCGGILNRMDWNTHFIFNIFFTFLALIGIIVNKLSDANKQSF